MIPSENEASKITEMPPRAHSFYQNGNSLESPQLSFGKMQSHTLAPYVYSKNQLDLTVDSRVVIAEISSEFYVGGNHKKVHGRSQKINSIEHVESYCHKDVKDQCSKCYQPKKHFLCNNKIPEGCSIVAIFEVPAMCLYRQSKHDKMAYEDLA